MGRGRQPDWEAIRFCQALKGTNDWTQISNEKIGELWAKERYGEDWDQNIVSEGQVRRWLAVDLKKDPTLPLTFEEFDRTYSFLYGDFGFKYSRGTDGKPKPVEKWFSKTSAKRPAVPITKEEIWVRHK